MEEAANLARTLVTVGLASDSEVFDLVASACREMSRDSLTLTLFALTGITTAMLTRIADASGTDVAEMWSALAVGSLAPDGNV